MKGPKHILIADIYDFDGVIPQEAKGEGCGCVLMDVVTAEAAKRGLCVGALLRGPSHPWRHITVAHQPTEESELACVGAILDLVRSEARVPNAQVVGLEGWFFHRTKVGQWVIIDLTYFLD